MTTEFDMSGKVAMVTGASSGFGVNFAKISGARGAKVVVAARRVDRLERWWLRLRLLVVKLGGAYGCHQCGVDYCCL